MRNANGSKDGENSTATLTLIPGALRNTDSLLHIYEIMKIYVIYLIFVWGNWYLAIALVREDEKSKNINDNKIFFKSLESVGLPASTLGGRVLPYPQGASRQTN